MWVDEGNRVMHMATNAVLQAVLQKPAAQNVDSQNPEFRKTAAEHIQVISCIFPSIMSHQLVFSGCSQARYDLKVVESTVIWNEY